MTHLVREGRAMCGEAYPANTSAHVLHVTCLACQTAYYTKLARVGKVVPGFEVVTRWPKFGEDWR